jgi:hypothetical protein
MPNLGSCSSTTTMTIVVNSGTIPTGESLQTFNNGATLASIVVNPNVVDWFASAEDALANINPLSLNQPLIDGTTYYAVNTNGPCASLPFAVTVSVVLSTNDIDFQNLK